jgi:hypothetical protein
MPIAPITIALDLLIVILLASLRVRFANVADINPLAHEPRLEHGGIANIVGMAVIAEQFDGIVGCRSDERSS